MNNILLWLTVDFGYSVIVWTILLIFFIATVYWLFEMLVVGRASCGPLEYGPEDVEVRIMTIDAESVVQATVDVLPDNLSAVRVIAERDINIQRATVHAVPDDFVCEATRKGRAIEWARQQIPCEAEYVLYLDEDTLLEDFEGLPDADLIQLSEHPIRSDSWLAYLAEIFRMGFQYEQATFPRFRYPMYAWGGGFAIRKTVEDQVTWNVNSVTEDTNFIWRAFEDSSRDLAFLRVRAMNQAPPSVREMIHQRRRWISGAANDSHLLPYRYQILSLLRNAAWGLVFLSPLLLIPVVTPFSVVFSPELYLLLFQFQLIGLFGWAILGYWYSGERLRVLLLLLVTIPLVAVIHAAGAFWAIVSPTTNFRVTRKVTPTKVKDEDAAQVIPAAAQTGQNRRTEMETETAENSDSSSET
ncbi:hypothetical protein J2751_002627 [Halorubrum alkaliphilum]|uniref:Glycosyltransferase 2-like domain-containing protein n=1 Tax=Halorubrum alkaliphilum TaxID=261290 RepID=A0A8T4GGC3_9EURY|nr:glycosyltransferase family 2 protein [Halorubrum alkaliphilum]MBP1923584.1 hypothetical protein [Halorubrum alkaliphilum]